MAHLGNPFKVVISLAAFALLSWSAYLALFTSKTETQYPKVIPHEALEALVPPSHDQNTTRLLRLFMPADSPHVNLCKTILSAAALGYPMPTLLNWSREYNRPHWHFAGSHIAKLESLLEAVEALLDSGASQDDLAVMMDAYDIWFQLPPSVLLRRYHQLNREADARLRDTWHTELRETQFPIPPPRQDIVVTTAKDCFPDRNSGSDPHYEHWPESPMPADMYGEETDRVPFSFDSARKYKRVRPRCVNSGMIMGSMGALRDVLRRCRDKVDAVVVHGRQLWSDQALFAEVIGEQEMWRKWARTLEASWDGGESHNDLASLSPEIRAVAQRALDGRRFEFGIGLDYNFTTMPPTCSSEEDGAFVRLNDAEQVRTESAKAGVDVRLHGIPELDESWGDVPLYSDLFFGTTPVAIHHNAYVGGLKSWRLKHWWDKMWFHGQLRDLVTRRPPAPLANVDDLVYWAPDEQKVTVFDNGLKPMDWDGVCQKGKTKWYDEVFGDNKGPLK